MISIPLGIFTIFRGKRDFMYIKSDHGQFCLCWFSAISGSGYTIVMQNVKIFSQSSLWNRFFTNFPCTVIPGNDEKIRMAESS
jgi:hypothetical protein